MSESPLPLLELKKVTKHFGERLVLQGIDLCVPPGGVVSLIGPSGSGKSTLLRCINYLEEPDAGSEVWLDGEQIGRERRGATSVPRSARELRRQRRHIGMVFQQFNLFPNMTVLENIIEGPVAHRIMSKKEAQELAAHLLQQVGLVDKDHDYPSRLSGGQQQRVAIARALAMKPKLILFDEVTSALDPELVDEVLKVMLALAKGGMTMIVVTHEMSFARDVSDLVLFMDHGLVVERGPPTEVMRQPKQARTAEFLRRSLRSV